MSQTVPPLGTLTDRIQLKRRETTSEDEGGQGVAYVPVATVWARVRSLSGRQNGIADGRGAAITHSVVLRYRTDLRPGDRIVYRGHNLEIVAAGDLNGGRAYLSCQCAEQAVSG